MDFNKTPLVSVIIPIYNVEKYLERCIISVVHQTYKNLEIILVNDGSPDNSLSICEVWKKRDSRIKVLNKPNGGLSDARNSGLRIATGDLIAFVDSDDWISINMIENMVLELCKQNADMVVCDFVSVYDTGYMEKNIKESFTPKVISSRELMKLTLKDREITNHVWRRLYKRELIIEDIFPVGKNFEDVYTSPIFISKCSKIVVLSEAYYYYRINNEGIVKSVSLKNCEDYFESILASQGEVLKNYPDLISYVKDNLRLKLMTIWHDLDKVEGSLSKKKLRKRIQKLHRKNEKIFNYKSDQKLLSFEIYTGIPTRIVQKILIKIKILMQKKFDYQRKKELIDSLRLSKSKKFVILGAPRYGNLGDLALLQGEINFINKFFPDYRIKEIPDNLLQLFKDRPTGNNKDIYAIQAGGNIGTLYQGIHKDQEIALSNIESNNLMVFPQTFFYDLCLDEGEKILQESCELYKKKNVLTFTRDKTSYDFVSKHFEGVKVNLVPDIALMIDGFEYAKTLDERAGVFLCLRNDSERTLTDQKMDYILKVTEKFFTEIQEGDTHRYNDEVDDDTFKYVEPLLKKIGSKRMMLTDRLHGMIFAAITSTPCIVITSKSPKVKGVYEWIKYLPYIKLVENLDDLEKSISEVLAVENPKFENRNLMKEFEKMATIIKNNMENCNE